MRFLSFLFLILSGISVVSCGAPSDEEGRRLRVVLIPADGGTADGTLADYAPLFRQIGDVTQTEFQLTVGSSYNSVVDAMCSGSADLAFLGPVTYVQAETRGCAEFLASGVVSGQAVYYSGLFVRTEGGIGSLSEVKGRSAAFGDINSTTAFIYPLILLMDAGIDPVKDLSAIRMTGSHANSLAALAQGQVDIAGASFESFEKAVRQGAIDPASVRVLARSQPIPYPPLAMNTRLDPETKKMLRQAFAEIHLNTGSEADNLKGYGGKTVEKYETDLPNDAFENVSIAMNRVDDTLKGEILRKAGAR